MTNNKDIAVTKVLSGIQKAVKFCGNQTNLAEKLNISPQAVSHMVIAGEATSRHLNKIALLTGISREELKPSLFNIPKASE